MVRADPGRSPETERTEIRFDTAPLTVAGVARTLGVAASTLRTWDRRYGLGPSSHQAGSHRRYSPRDVARLQVMRRLTLRGVAPVDAARIATETQVGEAWPAGARPEPVQEVEELVIDPLTLAAAVIEPDLRRVARILQRGVAKSGLAEAWASLVVPAFEMLAQRRATVAMRPGADPEGVLEAAVMQIVRDASLAGGAATPSTAGVRVLTTRKDRLVAHVVAGGLAERTVHALVVRAEDVDPRGPLSWLTPARILVVVGDPAGIEEIVAAASANGVVEVLVLGRESPRPWAAQVQRVRTVSAAVAEAAAIAMG